MPEELHIVPIGDFREHIEDRRCWCKPEADGLFIWKHNSMDRREHTIEKGILH